MCPYFAPNAPEGPRVRGINAARQGYTGWAVALAGLSLQFDSLVILLLEMTFDA